MNTGLLACLTILCTVCFSAENVTFEFRNQSRDHLINEIHENPQKFTQAELGVALRWMIRFKQAKLLQSLLDRSDDHSICHLLTTDKLFTIIPYFPCTVQDEISAELRDVVIQNFESPTLRQSLANAITGHFDQMILDYNFTGFLSLPKEIQFNITQNLSLQSLCAMMGTCWDIRDIIQGPIRQKYFEYSGPCRRFVPSELKIYRLWKESIDPGLHRVLYSNSFISYFKDQLFDHEAFNWENWAKHYNKKNLSLYDFKSFDMWMKVNFKHIKAWMVSLLLESSGIFIQQISWETVWIAINMSVDEASLSLLADRCKNKKLPEFSSFFLRITENGYSDQLIIQMLKIFISYLPRLSCNLQSGVLYELVLNAPNAEGFKECLAVIDRDDKIIPSTETFIVLYKNPAKFDDECCRLFLNTFPSALPFGFYENILNKRNLPKSFFLPPWNKDEYRDDIVKDIQTALAKGTQEFDINCLLLFNCGKLKLGVRLPITLMEREFSPDTVLLAFLSMIGQVFDAAKQRYISYAQGRGYPPLLCEVIQAL